MLHCYACTQSKCVRTCERCRKVLKYQMVLVLLQQDRIYLSEQTRHKTWRPSTLITNKNTINKIIKTYEQLHSYHKVATILNLKKHQVASVINTYLFSINPPK